MNHIQSPRPVSDETIEEEIKRKGLVAPRVLPQHLEDAIDSEHYFRGSETVDVYALEGQTAQALSLLTFCVLVLRNGFTVTGESACASPENFDAEVGRKIAKTNAMQKIWPLMGYALKQKLHDQGNPT